MSNPSESDLPETEPVTLADTAIRSVVTFTEVPGSQGGFGIGLGLHGAHQQALHPELETQRVSIVDILALAVAHTVRTQPKAFQESIALVKATILDMNARLSAGEDEAAVIGSADQALDGALLNGGRLT